MGRWTVAGVLRGAIGSVEALPLGFRLLQALCDPFRFVPVRQALARVPHSSLLDLGCGTGDLCRLTKGRYTGVDISTAYIEYARRRFGGPNRELRRSRTA